jgi:Arc/MetJ family transcription regulator
VLVRQLLLGRLEGLGASEVAAFVLGWSSALDLVERSELSLPEARAEVHEAVRELVERLRVAQEAVLEDDP